MSKIEVEPRFEIGDIVVLKSQVVCSPVGRVQVAQIVERLIVQCYGGTQVTYHIRIATPAKRWGDAAANGDGRLFNFTEPELDLPSPETVAAWAKKEEI
jgi:hypothetical protein